MRRATTPAPRLLDRALDAGCTRVAVIGLHPGAGSRTVLERLAAELHDRRATIGLTRVPRPWIAGVEEVDAIPPIRLPAGSVVATLAGLDEDAPLETLEMHEPSPGGTAPGVFRVARDAEVKVLGPEEPASIGRLLDLLERHGGKLVLVDGTWERKGFAAPGLVHGVVLAAGAGLARTPEHVAAAVRSRVEALTLPRAGAEAAEWLAAAGQRGAALVIDSAGELLDELPVARRNPTTVLRRLGARVASVVLPGGLDDAFIGPLARSDQRFELVLRDATRQHAAPIYTRAWARGGGTIRVVEPIRVIAVATNPVNHTGPDADPEELRGLVSQAVGDIPVHDVRLEGAGHDRRGWRFWRGEPS